MLLNSPGPQCMCGWHCHNSSRRERALMKCKMYFFFPRREEGAVFDDRREGGGVGRRVGLFISRPFFFSAPALLVHYLLGRRQRPSKKDDIPPLRGASGEKSDRDCHWHVYSSSLHKESSFLCNYALRESLLFHWCRSKRPPGAVALQKKRPESEREKEDIIDS